MPFTADQKQAIYDRNQDILVSASAGSGKTTVLVERVLQEILSGTSVEQLLVVTFTKAAAAEMKQRIKTALTQKISESHNTAYLRSQLNSIDTANISTIDSFCLDVIHRFYYAVDLDPSFTVLTDETQVSLLKERALKEIEEKHLSQKDTAFEDFYQNFAGDREADAPRQLLLDLYDYAMAKPDYAAWLKNLDAAYQTADNLTDAPIWQNQVKPQVMQNLKAVLAKNQQLLTDPGMESTDFAKVKSGVEQFCRGLEDFLKALETDLPYDEQRAKLKSLAYGNFRKSSKWDELLLEFYQQVQAVKEESKEAIKDNFVTYYVTDEQQQIAVLKQAKSLVKTISQVEQELINRFNQLKRQENFIDFSDMEQLAYQILSQDTSNSQLARSFYQNKFKEILVDEYQDINPLQERLLQLLKKDGQNNLFMVGDVKQSIYGFRQAEPSLFLHKYHDFSQGDKQERILLADNFRSAKPVTATVNRVFKGLLTTDFGGIDYQKEGQLVFGAKYYPEDLPAASEFIYHQKATTTNDDATGDFLIQGEIPMVIARIQRLKAEGFQVFDPKTKELRPLKYSDIVLLTRSRSDNLSIMQAFSKANIPLFITDAENYFQTLELTVMMNYLKIIDNPDQDIPLVSVLRSPIFKFNEPELAKIRIHNRGASFYGALTSYVAVKDDLAEKVKRFLNQLAQLRDYAAKHRISELIWSIYERTNLLEIMTSLPNGKQRRVNLEALYERAASYESAGFKGLYQFIDFINRMRKNNKDLAQPLLSQEAGEAVRLMTIHGSKGLEFPIVFYLGAARHYQKRDLNSDYVITQAGLGITVKQSNVRIDSLAKSVANQEKERQLLEEEARILYVALTRARQKLIIVADIANLDKKLTTWSWQAKYGLSLADKLSSTSPLDFIGPSLKLNQQLPNKLTEIDRALEQDQDLLYIKVSDEELLGQEAATAEQEPDLQKFSLLEDTAKKLFEFKYPFTDASQKAAYQSVSEIKNAFNDPLEKDLENAKMIKSANRYLQPIDTKPTFLYQSKFSAPEIGTAVHLVLQYFDYSQLNGSGEPTRTEVLTQVENEVRDLVKHHKLNPQLAQQLPLDEIVWFVRSDFARPFRDKPANLYRETDFSSLIPAKQLYDDFSDPAAKILVHGTIDGYFVEDNGILLFDYKTDYIPKQNPDATVKRIKQKYQGQLRLYEQAINGFSQKQVKAKYLILLSNHQICQVD